LVMGPLGEPMWVPASALVRVDEDAEGLLVTPVDTFGSRIEHEWRRWTLPEAAGLSWGQVGDDGGEILIRRWDPEAGVPAGALRRVSALDVVERREESRASVVAAGGDGEVRAIQPVAGTEPSSAALIARFLGYGEASESRALPSRSVADELSW